MKKSKSGFTIVELLVVIVVIGILASITVVTYNGIQTRAKNTKTVSAISTWIDAMKLYNAEKGSWPTTQSCIGKTTTYVGSNGQCWNSAYWIVRDDFLNSMRPYIPEFPEPDTTDIGASIGGPIRGALYVTNGTTVWQIFIVQAGSQPCPDIGLSLVTGPAYGTGRYCVYNLD